jgi:hypothetical protein
LGLPSFGEESNIYRAHGRRHSVNVLNKTPQSNSFGLSAPSPIDGFEDGFSAPPAMGGHSRSGSRVDSSWRISKFYLLYMTHVLDISLVQQMGAPALSRLEPDSLLSLSRLKPNFKVFNNSEPPQEGTTRKWRHSVSPTCCQT